ncbi:General stress protein 69 [Hartmannibacter diazotrophicus]|uniref:General stress protein 69 n=1 Tax=Hartmannibacter diazotrophicus TaxID=1482074 RepID=A0A2C9DE49_9HYPH|nr:aldo/keto reductase [Hartmannibacter diazotrophicus]SON58071.1 General stress protein 69 [Hartmannibacter diazotrophicus]
MQYRPLGRTGLTVSSICLGTMTFGEQNSEAEGFAQMDMALDHGVNFLDAAELYPSPPKPETQGRTEEIVGNWVKARGLRDKVIVATKVIGRSEMTWFRNDGSEGRLTKAQIDEAIDKSLRRLKMDYVDLYQVHWPEREVSGFGSNPTRFVRVPPKADETPIEDILGYLDDLVTAGKVRHVGLSNESSWGLMRFVAGAEVGKGPRVASIQNAYSLVNRIFEVNLAEACDREDVSLLAYSPLAQGYLTGKYENGALPKGSRKQLFNRLQRYEKPGTAEAISTYVAIARDFGVDPALFANAFVTSRPFVTSNIVGATSTEQLKVAIASASFDFTSEMEAAVDAAHQLHGNPCP